MVLAFTTQFAWYPLNQHPAGARADPKLILVSSVNASLTSRSRSACQPACMLARSACLPDLPPCVPAVGLFGPYQPLAWIGWFLQLRTDSGSGQAQL